MIALDSRLNAFRSDLADLALQGRVAAPRYVEGRPFQVAAAQAALRRAPAEEATLLTEALHGETASVFETTADGWAWVQLEADRYVGWMNANCLTRNERAPTHKVTALRTFVFAHPDIKSRPRAALPMGALVTVSGRAEDKNARYGLIEPDGAIVLQHLAPIGSTEPDWVAVAERFIGTPYLWGGKTSFGIDCSGLVQVALIACGVAAPRDSDMQESAVGVPLPLETGALKPRRGDLVFWQGHVGIMLDGEMLLHANAHHMAVAAEPLRLAVERQKGRGSEVTSIRRLGDD